MRKFIKTYIHITDPKLEEMGCREEIKSVLMINPDRVEAYYEGLRDDGFPETIVSLKSGEKYFVQISFSDFENLLN